MRCVHLDLLRGDGVNPQRDLLARASVRDLCTRVRTGGDAFTAADAAAAFSASSAASASSSSSSSASSSSSSAASAAVDANANSVDTSDDFDASMSVGRFEFVDVADETKRAPTAWRQIVYVAADIVCADMR